MTIKTDSLVECTSGAGITAEGVFLEDGVVSAPGGVVAAAIKPAADSTTALKLQNAAGTAIITIDTSNSRVYFDGLVSTAPLGAELLANGTFATLDFTGWTAGANWSAASGAAVHSTGSTATLAQSIAVTSGTTYEVIFTMSGRTTGSITITLGSVTLDVGSGTTAITSNTTYDKTIVAGATGSIAFTLTPTTDFNGTIDTISIKAITGTTNSALSLRDSAGSVFAEVRGAYALASTAFGRDALSRNTTGLYNIAVGLGALSLNTTGGSNTAIGVNALTYNTVGENNTAIGLNSLAANTSGSHNTSIGRLALATNTTGVYNTANGIYALRYNTTGGYDSAIGSFSMQANTTGLNNTAIGSSALRENTVGNGNVAIGVNAGRWQANFSTALGDPENSIYIGTDAAGKDNSDSNSIVIGYSAVGLGANTTVIGNSSTTLTAFPGGAIQISEMAAPTGVANKATVYTRDSGGGKTVLCCKLGDDVEIVLATQA